MENSGISLFNEIGGCLSDTDKTAAARLQAELFNCMIRKSRLYTLNDSSSIPVETAQELFTSICFLLSLYKKETGFSLLELREVNIDDLLGRAIKTVRKKTEECMILYEEVLTNMPNVQNVYLNDTLRDTGAFFKRYNFYYFAHQIPCMIDYPLCTAVSESLLGIEYMTEYLRRVAAENFFLRQFSFNTLHNILSQVHHGYEDLPLNLCSPILVNSIGFKLLNESVAEPAVLSPLQKQRLFQLFSAIPRSEIATKPTCAAHALLDELSITHADKYEYLLLAACALRPAIEWALTEKNPDLLFLM